MHVSTLSVFAESTYFLVWWLIQRTAIWCSSVGILFGIIAGPLVALHWSVGFENIHRLNFYYELWMIISVCVHMISFWMLFLNFFCCGAISEFDILTI